MRKVNAGVYKITNSTNDKCYVGSSKNISGRWNDHKKALRKGSHHSILLQRAWNKYGESSFVFEIIEKTLLLEQLVVREQYYKDLYKSYDRKHGYDICPIAGNTLGTTLTSEHKAKLSLAHKGLKHSEETKAKIARASKGENNPMYGRRHSLESRRKISVNTRAGMLASRAAR